MTKGKEAGLNVVRAWATSASSNYALQTSPGNFSEAMFRGLDYALDQARQLDLKVGCLFGHERQSSGLPGRLNTCLSQRIYTAKTRVFFSCVIFSSQSTWCRLSWHCRLQAHSMQTHTHPDTACQIHTSTPHIHLCLELTQACCVGDPVTDQQLEQYRQC